MAYARRLEAVERVDTSTGEIAESARDREMRRAEQNIAECEDRIESFKNDLKEARWQREKYIEVLRNLARGNAAMPLFEGEAE